jgi:peptidoglycan/xylan/chitin deacetylase (PgdA/CDA1 family)
MTPRAFLRRTFARVEGLVTVLQYPLLWGIDRLDRESRICIFALHKVAPLPPETAATPYYNLHPDRFERLLDALQDAGIPVIRLSEFVRARREGLPLPRRAVVFTFDDGFESVVRFAYPRMKERNFPFTLFLATDGIEAGEFPFLRWDERSRRDREAHPAHWVPLSWSSAGSLDPRLVEFGSHTCAHVHLARLPDAVIRRELVESRERIEQRLGVRVELFAYPYGTRAYGAFDHRTAERLAECGYRAACTSEIGRCSARTDLYELKRIDLGAGETPFSLRCKLAGAYTWVGWMRRRFQRVFADVARPTDAAAAGDGAGSVPEAGARPGSGGRA